MILFCSSSLEVVVKDLQAYTIYEFAIKSHAGDTSGDFSHEVRCRTKEASKCSVPNFQANDWAAFYHECNKIPSSDR
jgi:hypothetical protein